jgi:hypothetical protein
LEKSVCLEVETPNGKATVVRVFITELGHLMAKIYYKKERIWRNHQIASMDDLMIKEDIKVVSSKSTSTKKSVIKKVFSEKVEG